MSADGRIVCACPSTGGQLRISRDWGQTWFHATNAPAGGSLSGNPVALSADGSKIIACLSSNTFNQHWIFLSTDFGTNWTKSSLPPLQNAFSGYCLACSADGSNLIAAENLGPIHFSTNSGADWSTATAPSTNWASVASSADGRRMVAAVRDERVYFSTNFGSTWTSSNLSTQKWASVCISSDGNSVGAIGTNSYISRDAGLHWRTNKFSNASIACSANGTTWMIAGAQVSSSSDGSVTWFTNFSNPNATWNGVMSADGCEIVINQTSGSGGLTNWVGHITPSPQLNIQPQDTNRAISWLVPSTNFVLQQNSDLATTNWVTVSNSPTLNFTNLQYEVAVPDLTNNGFFRLVAQ